MSSARPAQSIPLVVAQLTDTHLFADAEQTMKGIPTVKSLAAVLQQVRQHQPDVLLLTGDLSQDETLESYQNLHTLVSPLNLPTYWIPGNHDRPEMMAAPLQQPPMLRDKAFQMGGWQFLLLNTAVPEHVEGALSPESLQWLEQELQHCQELPTAIALHHPPCSIHSAWMDEINLTQPELLLEIVDRHPQVRLILFGHIHQEFYQERRGVTYLGSPSTCVQFVPESEVFTIDKKNPGFRLFHLYPDGTWKTQVHYVPFTEQQK